MKTELEKCLAGEPFFGGDPEIAAIAAKAKRLTRELNDTPYTDIDRKRDIMRRLFGRVGRRVHIDVDFHCEYGRHILIGDRVIINMNCTFVDNNIIEIGNDVARRRFGRLRVLPYIRKARENMRRRMARRRRNSAARSDYRAQQRNRRRQRSDPFRARQLRGRGQSVPGNQDG